MTPKQASFVAEYLVDLNATQAAIRAGYSPKTAGQIGDENLKKPEIAAALQEAMKAREQRTEITQDRVLRELARIGFADIRKVVKWGEGTALVDPETGSTVVVNDVALIGSEAIDEDTALAISEISQTAQGLKIKMHDKKGALVDIGRHLGMFLDRTEISGSVQIVASALDERI